MKKNIINDGGQIGRRSFLKGLGTAMALPMLDAMAPLNALAETVTAGASSGPTRMAFLFVPNGIHMPDWTPASEGFNYDLPRTLAPLEPLKQDILVLSGLTHDKGRANGDGPGDHARSAGVYLTGAQPLKSEGSEIRAGVSVDQFAAQHIGHQTRFASLELGAEGGRPFGKCDSGYACAYSNNISWKDETSPVAKETDPRMVFERLFANELKGEMNEREARQQRYKKSVLDFIMEDARRLNNRVNQSDRAKLDEYFTAIREIETRIERLESENTGLLSEIAADDRPGGIPETYEEHIRLLGDMMILAFQTDVTRITSFMFANAASGLSYRQIGIGDGHHSISHHQNDPVKHAKLQKINEFHVRQLAYMLQKMKSIKEGDSTLLDNTMLVYGSSISDGNRHNNENLPIILAGKGGGSLLSGRHIRYPEETPLCNLFNSMLDRVGLEGNSIGDGTGTLKHLAG